MGAMRWFCAFGICTIFCARASACFCNSTPMCSQIGELSGSSNAVFVGKVTDVWPARQTIAGESRRLSLTAFKQLILERWHGTLTAEEERDIRATTDRDTLEFRFGSIQRVRFSVSEFLAGPRVREVYTDTSSCGYSFKPGLTYLVNANHDGPRYRTGACSRTNRVSSDEAVEDLKVLRAWRTGNPLPPRIYGQILTGDLRPDTRVRLIEAQGQVERLARFDPNGRFSLDDLAKTKYRFQVEDSRGKGDRLIDLSSISCFEATPWFSEVWHIAGSPVALEPEPPPPLSPPKQ
jgi:hypothetical protein